MPWFGYWLMAIIGGIVAHVREWEAKDPSLTTKQHVVAIVRRSTMATLAGLMWYYTVIGAGWSNTPFAYVGASLVGLFSPEFFDLLWSIFKDRLFRSTTAPTVNPPVAQGSTKV